MNDSQALLDLFALAVRVLVALVFLGAALGKLRKLQVFEGIVSNYRLLPDALVAAFARVLPVVEALVGVALLSRRGMPWAGYAAIGLLVLFAGAMAINIRRGRSHIDCGCYQGTMKQTLSWTLVARNAALALATSAASLIQPVGIDGPLLVEGLATGVILFVLLNCLNVLWGIVPAWRQHGVAHSGAMK